MLLNTTITAQIATTTANAALVIAGLFVRAASVVVYAGVPKQVGKRRSMRWSDLWQLDGEHGSERHSDRLHRSLPGSTGRRSCQSGTCSGRS